MSTIYLRNKTRDTVVDVEVWTNVDKEFDTEYTELRSVICIKPYSSLLLENQDKASEIIDDFERISELRGWLWEKMLPNKNDGTATDVIRKSVVDKLQNIGQKYGLYVVED